MKEPEKEEADEEEDIVRKVVICGKEYLKSKKTGDIYNMDQELIGNWNEKEEKIEYC